MFRKIIAKLFVGSLIVGFALPTNPMAVRAASLINVEELPIIGASGEVFRVFQDVPDIQVSPEGNSYGTSHGSAGLAGSFKTRQFRAEINNLTLSFNDQYIALQSNGIASSKSTIKVNATSETLVRTMRASDYRGLITISVDQTINSSIRNITASRSITVQAALRISEDGAGRLNFTLPASNEGNRENPIHYTVIFD